MDWLLCGGRSSFWLSFHEVSPPTIIWKHPLTFRSCSSVRALCCAQCCLHWCVVVWNGQNLATKILKPLTFRRPGRNLALHSSMRSGRGAPRTFVDELFLGWLSSEGLSPCCSEGVVFGELELGALGGICLALWPSQW